MSRFSSLLSVCLSVYSFRFLPSIVYPRGVCRDRGGISGSVLLGLVLIRGFLLFSRQLSQGGRGSEGMSREVQGITQVLSGNSRLFVFF